jgi:single-strand DNA-binding protein
MNQLTVCGNASEPQLKYTTGGMAVATFAVFTKRKVKDEQVSTAHNIKAWGELAENLCNTIQKGDRVIVSGRIEVEEYNDKEGNPRKNVVLVADEAGVSLRWLRNAE